MTKNTKQLKISKLLERGARKVLEDEKHVKLQEEIHQLETQLKGMHYEWFQLQRNSYKFKATAIKKMAESFVRPETIVLTNAVDHLKKDLELISELSGIEVQSYVLNDHCCIVFNMQHASEHKVKHGLRIELKNGANKLSHSNLPLGFNLNAVMADFDNIMLPECLGAIRNALVAYYNRLEQFEALKKMLKMEAQLFKILDGSHIEVSFVAQKDMDENIEPFDVVLMLEYRLYDIRPKLISFKETEDFPEDALDVIKEQCVFFKKKPLDKAFRDAFVDGAGPYKLVEQVGTRPAEPIRRRNKRTVPNRDYNNDDTFLPEDVSEHSDVE